MKIHWTFSLLVGLILVGGSLLTLVPEYLTKRGYYRELSRLSTQLDKKHLLAEVVEPPDFLEGQLLCEALRVMGKSMNDEIARFALASSEYREYIELWVHEIKTPIAGMKLMSENIRNQELPSELDRVEFLVEQVLFYARSNAVSHDFQIRLVALQEIVGTVVKGAARLLISQHIRIQTSDLALEVPTDAKWVVFILRQLVNNSVKYGATQLEFFSEQHDGSVSLFVRDNGIGISAKDLDHVFEKGFTGENGRHLGRATGLGLYLCQKLCTKLGLGISAHSKLDEGTTIEIVFPRRDPFA
jgi:signal transduction histidine kinase